MQVLQENPARQAFYARLAAQPWAHDFYQGMRRLECLYPAQPRWGLAKRPADEPVRLSQEASLAFAPASISRFSPQAEGQPWRLEFRFFGLLGPNGPLPLHITEHARERLLHANDAGFVRFLDILHHRFAALFYRAWAQAQPTVSLDRPQEDRFADYIGALSGIAGPGLRRCGHVADNARRFQSAHLARQVRNAEGLEAVLAEYFRLPVRIEQFVGHWMPIEPTDQSRLGASQLGRNAVLGRQVWDRQSKIRIHLGPLSAAQYADFLPTGSALPKLADWVRLYTGGELFWDLRLILRSDEVPSPSLGRAGQLGWMSWVGQRAAKTPAGELLLDVDRVARD